MTTQANPPRPRNGPQVSDPLATEDEARTLLFNRISWGAVLAGVMVALVTQLILNLIGIGIGAASFDPTSNANPSGSTFPSQPASGGPSLLSWRHWRAATLQAVYQASQRELQALGMDLPLGPSRHFWSSILCPPALELSLAELFAHSAPLPEAPRKRWVQRRKRPLRWWRRRWLGVRTPSRP